MHQTIQRCDIICELMVVFCFPLQRDAAEKVLKAFQEHPDAWTRVDVILEKAKTQQTKYFALQVCNRVSQGFLSAACLLVWTSASVNKFAVFFCTSTESDGAA